jgi:hypothetical protein
MPGSDPFSFSGAFGWKSAKGKKKGSKSTSAASKASKARMGASWKTLGI